MTEQELMQENAKLNARLQKAVTVFNEQKATIQRLTEERDAAIAKTKEAEEQDQLFFEQQSEIETLKADIVAKDAQYEELDVRYTELDSKLKEAAEANGKLTNENTKLNERLKKAAEEFEKLKEVNGVLLNRNASFSNFIVKIQDDCTDVLKQMAEQEMRA